MSKPHTNVGKNTRVPSGLVRIRAWRTSPGGPDPKPTHPQGRVLLWVLFLVIAASSATRAVAESKNFYLCPHGVDITLHKCPICSAEGRDGECRRAKATLNAAIRSGELSSYDHDEIAKMDCAYAKTVASVHTDFKYDWEIKAERDRREDERVQRQADRDRRQAQGIEDQAETAENISEKIEANAEALAKRYTPEQVQKIRDKLDALADQISAAETAAARRGDHAQASALSRLHSSVRHREGAWESVQREASSNRMFGSADDEQPRGHDTTPGMMPKMNSRDAPGSGGHGDWTAPVVEKGGDIGRQAIENRGYRTRVPGEGVAHRVKQYVDTAKKRAGVLQDLPNPVSHAVQHNIGGKIDHLMHGGDAGYNTPRLRDAGSPPPSSYRRPQAPAYTPPPAAQSRPQPQPWDASDPGAAKREVTRRLDEVARRARQRREAKERRRQQQIQQINQQLDAIEPEPRSSSPTPSRDRLGLLHRFDNKAEPSAWKSFEGRFGHFLEPSDDDTGRGNKPAPRDKPPAKRPTLVDLLTAYDD